MNYITKYENDNIIKISKNVIISIINTILMENNFIVNNKVGIFNNIIKKFFFKNINIIKLDENHIIAAIYINIKYGCNIYKTVETLQKSIIEAIESMTGIQNIQIDVNICKITFQKKIIKGNKYE